MNKFKFVFFGLILPLVSIYFIFWGPGADFKVKNIPRGIVQTKIYDENNTRAMLRGIFQTPFQIQDFNVVIRNRSQSDGKPATARGVILVDKDGNVFWGPKDLVDGEKAQVRENDFYVITTGGYDNWQSPKATTTPDLFIDDSFGAKATTTAKIMSSLIFLVAYGGVLTLANKFMIWCFDTFKG